jgi:TonB-dependent SusC/RagA subfamily outer membrane receptor
MNSFTRCSLFCLCALLGFESNAQQADTASKKHRTVETVNVKSNKTVTIAYSDGTSEIMSETEATKKGLIHNGGYGNQTTVNSPNGLGKTTPTKPSGTQPLYVLNGKEITEEQMKAINQETIESINVLKDKNATDKYGVKGKNGVIEINSKVKSRDNTDTTEAKGITEINVVEKDRRIFTKAQFPPSVDEEEWLLFLEKNLLPIAESVKSDGALKGNYTVQVQFIVEKDGSLSNTRVMKHPGYGLDKKILEMMKKSPRWKPAIQNGEMVRAIYTQPINISFSEN